MMLLGNVRGDLYSSCRSSRSAPHLTGSFPIQGFMSSPMQSSSTPSRTPITPQQTMMNYARMSYRYTTVTLLSMRPQPEITIFPDHLVERRFLDEENYIDLDRMLTEKAGQFRFESYGVLDGAGDGPILPSRIHKYDFSDPVVIEKVKNRRPKDPLTPHQVAALTSVVTRHQPSTLPTPLLSSTAATPASSHGNSPAHVWIDDYSHRQAQLHRQPHRQHLPLQPSMPYQRQNPNQCETYTNQNKPFLSAYRSHLDEHPPASPVPILQRLFQAQQHKIDQEHLSSAFATPASPQTSNTFAWPFSTNAKPVSHPLHLSMSSQSTVKQNQNVLAQLMSEHARSSSTMMQTPATPSVKPGGLNYLQRKKDDNDDDDDDDEQNFYSAPPSPTHTSSMLKNSNNPEQTRIYNQAVLLNSLIRNMVNDQPTMDNDLHQSTSNESCQSDQSQATSSDQQESYTEMSNLIRLLSPGVKNVAQQDLLRYLEQGCAVERDEMLRLVSSLSLQEQNSLKPILVRLINEQCEVMKTQQDHWTAFHRQASNPSHDHRSPLESWFGAEIYKNAYPRMPSGGVLSADDLEQTR